MFKNEILVDEIDFIWSKHVIQSIIWYLILISCGNSPSPYFSSIFIPIRSHVLGKIDANAVIVLLSYERAIVLNKITDISPSIAIHT